jgi:signal peptidase
MKNTLKRIGSAVLDVLIIFIFIISILVVIAGMSARGADGQANVFGYVAFSVQTDSMEPTINTGDLIIGKIPNSAHSLPEGAIVSFREKIGNQMVVNTHRIYKTDDSGSITKYTTWGDNRESCPAPDATPKTENEIISVYQFRIPLVGAFIDFIREPLGFILVLVIPMLAFIAWQVYKLIDIYLKNKKMQMQEEIKNESKADISDEEKDAIIREYLAKQQMEGKNDPSDKK